MCNFEHKALTIYGCALWFLELGGGDTHFEGGSGCERRERRVAVTMKQVELNVGDSPHACEWKKGLSPIQLNQYSQAWPKLCDSPHL